MITDFLIRLDNPIIVNFRNKLGYATGDLGISISYFAVGFFFIYYLTDLVLMDPILAGLAFFIGKLWDGINDPLMGIISDRTRSKYGRKRVFILFGAIPFGISFYLLWLVPLAATVTMQFIFATLALIFYGTMYTVVVVPYMALVPVLTDDYDERTQITGYRAMLSSFASIVGGVSALALSFFTDEIMGLRLIAGIFTIISVGSLLIAAYSVRNIVEEPSLETSIVSALPKYLTLMKEKNVSILLGLKFFGAIGTGVLSASIPFFADRILGDPGVSTYGLAIYIIFAALFVPIWKRLTLKYDKRRLLMFSNIGVAIVLAWMGLTLSEDTVLLFYVGTMFLGIFMSAYLFIPYSLVPDLVDYYDVMTGERNESIFFGLWMSVHQLGIAFAGLIFTALLQYSGYDGELKTQSEEALTAIRIAFGIVTGLFLVLATVILQKYEITREVYNSMRERLSNPNKN